MENNRRLRMSMLAAMFLAIGQVLPFITGQIPQIGAMLSPMHLPILTCGYICGPYLGALIGFICPLLRSVLFGMPKIYPTAIAMAFELCTYGFAAGLLFRLLKEKSLLAVYGTLIITMIAGRIVWGLAQYFLLMVNGNVFTMQMFLTGALFNAIPAIILQLLLIPSLVLALNRMVRN